VTQAHCRLLIQSRQQLEGRSRLKCHSSYIWREDKQRPKELFQDLIDRHQPRVKCRWYSCNDYHFTFSQYGQFLPMCLGGDCADHQEFLSNDRQDTDHLG